MQIHANPLEQLSTATTHLRELLKSEMRLAKLELANNLKAARTGLILAAIGLAAILCTAFALTATLFLGLSAFGIASWLAALITTALLGMISILCFWVGLSRLSPKAIAPTEAAEHAAQSIRLVKENTYVS